MAMMPTDLFPPEGHRYLTDERIEELRQQAIGGEDVTLPALTVIELVCDWRNMTAHIAASSDPPISTPQWQ